MSHHKSASNAGDKPRRKKVTTHTIAVKKRRGTPITMVTAYDVSSARMVDEAGIDMILIGDSLAMVMLGHDNTVSITLDDMILHCRSVARGSEYPMRVGDLTFMSYNVSIEEAVRNAGRLLKEGYADAVKLEGGAAMVETVRAITNAGIPTIGHIGLTPQTLSQLGGYRIQGKSAESAHKLYKDAHALQEAGCIAIVLELVPEPVAAHISQSLSIPTIGIGAGVGCDGQVLVYHDMLGLLDVVHPRFLKRYANLSEQIVTALRTYGDEVRARTFPAPEHTYEIDPDALAEFKKLVEEDR